MADGALPLSVWPVAQRTSRAQRSRRYLDVSGTHPAKMLPALALAAIRAYSAPGDVVLDPMCGVGTTLVEAVHLGRDAVGVEYEPRWAELARANLALALAQGGTGQGQVLTGDGRDTSALVDPALRGLVGLVLTSPPYGPSVHGRVRACPRAGVAKSHDSYSSDPRNLASVGYEELLSAVGDILRSAAKLLHAGGVLAMTVRPWRRHGRLIDLPGNLASVGERVGLVLFERNVALLAALRDGGLVPRPSFFALERARKALAQGTPQLVIAHEDVLVFRKPQ